MNLFDFNNYFTLQMGDIPRPVQGHGGNYYPHPNFNGQPQQQPLQQQPPQQQQTAMQQPLQRQQQLPLQQQQSGYGPQQQQLPLQQQQSSYGQNYATQPQPPPVPTFQQGWGYGQPNEYPTSTPQAPPRAIIGEPASKKRALEVEDDPSEGDVAQAGVSSARGRGRGRGGRGGHLWGWVRFGFYKSKPTFPSCLIHKRAECTSCFEWVWN